MKQRFFLLLLSIVFLCTVLMLPIHADFGSFSGDSDYGGSYDYGDYDYGSGYDSYDYGGGTYYYYDDYDSDTEFSPVMIIFVIIITIVKYYFCKTSWFLIISFITKRSVGCSYC